MNFSTLMKNLLFPFLIYFFTFTGKQNYKHFSNIQAFFKKKRTLIKIINILLFNENFRNIISGYF